MRGNILLKALETLAAAAISVSDFAEVFLSVRYGSSYGTFERAHRKLERDRARRNVRHDEDYRMRQRYYEMVHRLKRDGLLSEKSGRDGMKLYITPKGRRKLSELQKQLADPLPAGEYAFRRGSSMIIVAFDIPEVEKRKRDWLRETLKRLELTMVQKSVWIGRVKIPQEFLEDLAELNITDHVEIFAVTKAGSLRSLN